MAGPAWASNIIFILQARIGYKVKDGPWGNFKWNNLKMDKWPTAGAPTTAHQPRRGEF